MNELKKINEQERVDMINISSNYKGELVVSSRDVAENFGKENKHINETIRKLMVENSTVKKMFVKSIYRSNRGREEIEYLMTRDGFSLLVMGFTGKKALEWKLKYIEAFNKMENELKNLPNPSYMIENPIDRAKKWISEREAFESAVLQIEELEHKAEYYDVIVDRGLNLNFRDTAKELNIGERKLIKFLLDKKYIFRNDNGNLRPYAKYVDKGYFVVREFAYKGSNVGVQTLVTPEGRLKIIQLLNKEREVA